MSLRRARSSGAVNKPYALVARFYDAIVPGIAAMNRHARERMLAGRWSAIRRVVEIACGNGATAVDLARRGLDVEALDLSPEFIRQAKARAAAAGVKPRFRVGDMRDFRVKRPVDLVVAEFSALNNLARRGELPRVLRCVARALRPGGLFLFDVDTKETAASKAPEAMWFEGRGFKLALRCAVDDRGRRARLDFEWFLPRRGALHRHVRETIWNVSWTAAELRRALRAAGLRSILVRDGVDIRPPMPGAVRGTDLHFLATRAGAGAAREGGARRRGAPVSGARKTRARASR